MAKICPPGFICIENMTIIFLILVLILAVVVYYYIINKELKDISFPCHKIGSLDEKITWFQKNKVLFNDTNFNINQLRKLNFL